MTTREITLEQAERANELAFAKSIYDRRIWEYDVVSGAQIKVVLGENVILEDCTAIQFTLTQSKKPIYGYHSTYFDAIASGIVIVHGRLWINFIHQGYLRTLLSLAKNSGSTEAVKARSRQKVVELDELRLKTQQGEPANDESVIEWVKAKNQERNLQYAATSGEDGKNYTVRSRPDVSKSLNIEIHYGDRNSARGVPIKLIYGVSFMAEGQDIQISGQPQQEWYEFLARRVT